MKLQFNNLPDILDFIKNQENKGFLDHYFVDFLAVLVYIIRIITKRKKYIMTKEIDIKITTTPITDFEDLHNKVDSLLGECNIKMTSLIEEYNTLLQENENIDTNINEVNTADLDSKFTVLADYVTDYSQ